jgi:hypothetical protein
MGKISIEIDITADELVQVISGLAVKTNSKAQKRKAPVTVKVMEKQARTKYKRGQKWTKQEEAWLRDYIETNSINKKMVRAFNRVFGSKRSFSSLANKGYEFRNQ